MPPRAAAPGHRASFDMMRRIILRPAILRVYWSTARAWPGSALQLCVETHNVPDETPLTLEVWSARLGFEGPRVHLEDGLAIERSRCVVHHTIDWDRAALTELFDRGDLDCNFVLHATIARYELVATSSSLYVALDPFTASY